MKKTIQFIKENLSEFYDPTEIESFTSMIFSFVFGYSKKDLIICAGHILPKDDFSKVAEVVLRLKNQEPIQYIFGEADFSGLKFKVEPGVLIPRFETEELVDLIIKRNQNLALKILDVGTGSGCIAISLKKHLPKTEIWCCDISDKALDISRENAKLNKVDIKPEKFDILGRSQFIEKGFDIIVSNPPYVTNKEKSVMRKNVLNFEPAIALFVPDNDPLLYYKAIVIQAKKLLTPDGKLYFEINEAFGSEVSALLFENGFVVEIIKDINGKDRIVYGSHSG
jgi:release factor glutamine methyltransferase